MPSPPDEPARRWNPATSRRVVLSVAIVALTVSTLATASLAMFTDTEQVDGNVFGTGSVDLVSSPASAVLSAPAMVPGTTVVAPLQLTNTGSLALRYAALSRTSESVFAAQLELTIKTGVANCTVGGFDAGGTVLYGPGILGSTATTVLFGDAEQGGDVGDRVIGPSSGEQLCFRVTLPLDSDDEVQGLTTSATFTFEAEQTLNNP